MVSTGAYIGAAVAPLIYASLLDAGLPLGVFLATSAFMLATAIITILQERYLGRR